MTYEATSEEKGSMKGSFDGVYIVDAPYYESCAKCVHILGNYKAQDCHAAWAACPHGVVVVVVLGC